MKRAAILAAVLCFAILGISQTPDHSGTAKQHGTSNADHTAESDKKTQRPADPLPNQTIIYRQYAAPEHKGSEDQRNEDVEIQRKLAKFTKYLVWVGALQFVALILQAIFFLYPRTSSWRCRHCRRR